MKNDPKSLKDELRPLKDLLEIIKNKVDRMETFQNVTMQQVRDIKDQQSVMNGKLDNMDEKLDSNTEAIVILESTITGYADMYKVNDSNIRRMEKRLEPVEKNTGIEVPAEFLLEPLPEAA